MDPIASTVIGGVLWLVLGPLGTVAVFWLVVAVFIGVSSLFGAEDIGGVVGGIVGWVAALSMSALTLIMVALHVVRLVQLLMGVEVTV